MLHARVVHQTVRPPECRLGLGHLLDHCSGARQLGMQVNRRIVQGSGNRITLLCGLDPVQNDPRAIGDQFLRDFKANATGRSGNQGFGAGSRSIVGKARDQGISTSRTRFGLRDHLHPHA